MISRMVVLRPGCGILLTAGIAPAREPTRRTLACPTDRRAVVVSEELRRKFKAIPESVRQANQSFAIRVWRALSWLQRVEQAQDAEDRFIAGWIGFNALYGRLDNQKRAWGDREAFGAFLAAICGIDHGGRLRHLVFKRQLPILRLVENRFLYDKFWLDPGANHEDALHQKVKALMPRFNAHNPCPILQVAFERLWILRNQLMHGAATKGSSLNRRTLTEGATLIGEFLPEFIDIMIENGQTKDWGEVCFPPIGATRRNKGDERS